MSGEPIEGRVLHPGAPLSGPRCYAHGEPEPGHGAVVPGRPAHVWGAGAGIATCVRCDQGVNNGDAYLCADDGIVHVTCPTPALPKGPARALPKVTPSLPEVAR